MGVNRNLLKYLNILHKSSKEFNSKLKKVRDKYFKGGEPSKEALKNEHVEELKPIMEYFYIPVTEDSIEAVAKHMVDNEPYAKFRVHYVSDEFDLGDRQWFTTPSILVELLDEMSKEEWEDIWEKRIKKNHKDRIIEEDDDSIKSLQSERSVYRKTSTFDEKLWVYRRSQELGSVAAVYRELSDGDSDKPASFKTVIDIKSLEKMARDVKKLRKDL